MIVASYKIAAAHFIVAQLLGSTRKCQHVSVVIDDGFVLMLIDLAT